LVSFTISRNVRFVPVLSLSIYQYSFFIIEIIEPKFCMHSPHLHYMPCPSHPPWFEHRKSFPSATQMRNISVMDYRHGLPSSLSFWHILPPHDVKIQRILNAILVSEPKRSTKTRNNL
jgi:hypothetical protein